MQSGPLADINQWQEANQNIRDWNNVQQIRDEETIAQMQE